MNRRDFLRTAGGAAGATAAVGAAGAGSATAAEGGGGGGEEGGDGGDGGGGEGGDPDFGGYLDDVPYFDGSVEDMRGQDEASVTVGGDANGNNSFLPAVIHVDNGATVVWEWTGQGSHNVLHVDGEFESDLVGDEGYTFEHTFEEDGVYNYYCDPHESVGMKGSVVVGTDFPTTGGDDGGSGGPQPLPDAVKTLGVATLTTLVATLGFAYAFIKYGGAGPVES